MAAPLPFLEPGQIGSLSLRNRLVRTATSESMALPNGDATEEHVRLYGDLAAGGAGLLITGHLYVEPRGKYKIRQSGLDDDARIPGWRRVTEAVHAQGGVIFAELSHAGSQSVVEGITPIAPSVIPNAIFGREPKEMTEADITEVIGFFGEAAKRAMAAGFDGIHIHSGNGYLLSEFNSPHANHRTDAWGGDGERRGRFLIEVYKAIRMAVGPNVPVTARIGIADAVPHGLTVEESLDRVAELEAQGLDGVETTYGIMNTYQENIRPYVAVTPLRAIQDVLPHRVFASRVPEAYYRPFSKAVKQRVKIPVILIGGMRTTETMADVVRSGDADFIAMARPFIREPDLPRQFAAGRRGLVDCVSCNLCLRHEGLDSLQCWRTPSRILSHIYKYYIRG